MSKGSAPGQRTSGLRALLSLAPLYEAFQRAVGAARFRQILVDEFLDVRARESVLDIGCGPGSLLEALPEVDYVGFDPSEAYIRSARNRFPVRGRFLLGGVEEFEPEDLGASFDLVVAQGVLHHLDDAVAARLFELARSCVHSSGRVVTIDPAFSPTQSRVANAIIRRDRGRYVRNGESYADLARHYFGSVSMQERHDLLRIPYTHAIVRCVP